MKNRYFPNIVFTITLILSACGRPTPIPLGPLSITLNPSAETVYFGGCDPHTLQIDAALSGDTQAVSHLNLEWGFSLSDGSVLPGANGSGDLPMTAVTESTYSWSYDFGDGVGWGPFDLILNLEVRAVDSRGAVLASASINGMQWLTCAPLAPASGETLIRNTENPQKVFYGEPANCPSQRTTSTTTFTAEVFDPEGKITSVRVISRLIDSGYSTVLTPPPLLLSDALSVSPFGGRLFTGTLDINRLTPEVLLAGGVGILSWNVEGLAAADAVVTTSSNNSLFIHSCLSSGSTLGQSAEEASQPTLTTAPSVAEPATPTLTATEKATPNSQLAAQVIPTLNAYCRKGPGTMYTKITFIQTGKAYNVIGRNSQNTWWQIQVPGTNDCWVGDANVGKQGPVEQVSIVQGLPLPGTPASFVNSYVCDITLGTLGVSFNWAAAVGVTGYRIYRNGDLLATVAENETSYHDDDAPLEQDLVYELEAFNADGVAARISSKVPACR